MVVNMKFDKYFQKSVEFARLNIISLSIIALCSVLIIVMICIMVLSQKNEVSAPISDVRIEVYQKGIQVGAELSTNDSMVEFARIYASGSDINKSLYFTKMQEFEDMCKTSPEERFFTAISAVVGLNLDAASLYADHEYELAEKFQASAAEQFEKVKSATTISELDTVINYINKQREREGQDNN